MAILALFRWQADADALVAAHDREMEDAPSVVVDQKPDLDWIEGPLAA